MGLRVTAEHARAAKLGGPGFLCAYGIRGWCRRHGIDLGDFLDNGLPIERLESIDDAYARRVVAIARAEAEATECDHGQE